MSHEWPTQPHARRRAKGRETGEGIDVRQAGGVLARVERAQCDAFAGRREHFLVEGRAFQLAFDEASHRLAPLYRSAVWKVGS